MHLRTHNRLAVNLNYCMDANSSKGAVYVILRFSSPVKDLHAVRILICSYRFLIPYVQRFTVTSLTLRSGASPLPAVWTLHGSRDGVTFTPWRAFEAGDAPQGREVSSRNIYALICQHVFAVKIYL